jgi:hypothetical protein
LGHLEKAEKNSKSSKNIYGSKLIAQINDPNSFEAQDFQDMKIQRDQK